MLYFEFGVKRGKTFDKKNILCIFVVEYCTYSTVVALESYVSHQDTLLSETKGEVELSK